MFRNQINIFCFLQFDQNTNQIDASISFGTSSFKSFNDIYFLIYRFLFLVFAYVTFFLSISSSNIMYPSDWIIYFTHWISITSFIYINSLFLSTLLFPLDDSKLMWYHVICWLTMYISLTGGILITILYWAFGPTQSIGASTVLDHGILVFCIFVDWIIGCQPFYFIHVIYTILFGWIYGVWTYIFYIEKLTTNTGDVFIYEMVRWDTNPVFAGLACFLYSMLSVIVVHFFLWCFFKCKNSTHKIKYSQIPKNLHE
jgi:hypothetical protein